MNVPFYKNFWNYLCVVIAVIIVVLAFSSVDAKNPIILPYGLKYSFGGEAVYKSLFNPLWAFFLWSFSLSRKVNYDLHQKVLHNIEGVLTTMKPNSKIKASVLHEIVYKNDDVVKKLEKKFTQDDTVKPGPSNPII